MTRFIVAAVLIVGMTWTAVSQMASSNNAGSEQNWSLEGTVTDASGKPVEGASVKAVAVVDGSGTTDAQGHYTITGEKAGRYGVFARKEGYVHARIRFVQLMANAKFKLDLVLEKESVLSGRVMARDGSPIVGADVAAWSRAFREEGPIFAFRKATRTDDLGRYRLTGLSEGDYFVGINPKKSEPQALPQNSKKTRFPQLAYPPLYYPGVQMFSDASPIRLRASEQHEGVDLIAERVSSFCAVGTIGITGSDLRGKNITLTLTETSKGWGHGVGGGDVRSGEQFELCGLVPGVAYTLTSAVLGDGATLQGFVETEFEGNRRDADLGIPLDLGALSIQPGQKVTGSIAIDSSQVDGGVFPRNVVVTLENTTTLPGYINETHEAQVSPSGDFILPIVFPYEHWLEVFGLPPGDYVKKKTCGRYDLLREPWRPGCGEVRVLIGIDAATVSGQAVNEEGQPVNDADVILVSKDSPDRIEVRAVSIGGSFQFPSIVPGEYRILAVAGIPGGQAHDPDVLSNYLSRATDLTLASKAQQSLTLTVIDLAR
jgi:hypothetical protein